jgi:hypothetical protein
MTDTLPAYTSLRDAYSHQTVITPLRNMFAVAYTPMVLRTSGLF